MTMSWRSNDGADESTTASHGRGATTGPIMEGKVAEGDATRDRPLSPPACDDEPTTTATATPTVDAADTSESELGLPPTTASPASGDHQEDRQDRRSHSSNRTMRSSPTSEEDDDAMMGNGQPPLPGDPGGQNAHGDPPYKSRLSAVRDQQPLHQASIVEDGKGETHNDDDGDGGGDDGVDEDEDDVDTDRTSSPRPREQQQQQQEEQEEEQSSSNSTASPWNNPSSSKPLQEDRVVPEDDTEGVDQEIPWKPQDTQSVCEFTHTITDYSSKRDSGCKKAEYSATTVDNLGNKWRLIVYVNGNGRASNHHLSLFLQVADADDLPFGWKKAVSYVLTLEHPSGASLSYAKRNPDKTFKLCPKAIDWGWSQFITSDRIQQEGFVQDDSLVVRASVTVKSSSVNIDIDDAELYLKCAVEEGKPEAVQLCLDQGASVNCQFKDDLYTPLHTACSATPADDADGDGTKSGTNILGSMQVLDLLLEKGADGNACNKWRETPLLIAANNGHRAAVEALLKHGADPSLCSEAGWSALTFAAHKGYDDIVALLLEDNAPVNCRVTEDSSTPLHKACAGSKPGHLRAVKLLLENDADVHALNKWRETPLLTAANHGQAGAVELLLKAGADPCKCTDTGWSPLSIAAYKGHDDVVKLLLEEGAPTEEADPTLSALLQAATKGLPDTVGLLLRHGADHTVTTKKGDTALSILVEQNLIDAAVEMVTEYKASVPRCSRDRKKVQRARLLINLRLKQQQREDLNLGTDDDDEGGGGGGDDDDDEDGESDTENSPTATAASAASMNDNDEVPRPGKRTAKKKKVSAEQQAKEAELALLLELEQEDAERHKQEEEANKKSAKKKKKKERERQQKKEQEERRIAEERSLEERRRKEMEAKEAMERVERERTAAAKKKEEDEIRGKQQKAMLQQQQREQEQRKKLQEKEEDRKTAKQPKGLEQNGQHPPAGQPKNTKGTKGASRNPKNPQPNVRSVTANNSVAGVAGKKVVSKGVTASAERNPPGKRRGWESLPNVKSAPKPPPMVGPANDSSHGQLNATLSNDVALLSPFQSSESINPSTAPAGNIPKVPQASATNFEDAKPRVNAQTNHSGPLGYGPAATMFDEVSISSSSRSPTIEPPSVALFRREKVSELLQRFSIARTPSQPLGFVKGLTLKKVWFRWIMRAAHEPSEFHDFMIPSWVDLDQLVTFFQRQFISEARKESRDAASGTDMLSMEALKEAGTAIAQLCHSVAKEVALFRRRVEEQLPAGWSDTDIGMTASEMVGNGHESLVVIDWARQAQVTFPPFLFSQMRERYQGGQTRLLSSMFAAKVCYSTRELLVGDTGMDLFLLPATKSMLAVGLSVTAEVWCDPFRALPGNAFWGLFSEVDSMFGGFKPFGAYGSSDDVLKRNGGSVSVLAPPDSLLASRYLHRIIDILEYGEQVRVPLSFAIFLRSDCLVDPKPSPSVDDFLSLDPRLREREMLISRIGRLPKGKHSYYDEILGSGRPSMTDSLFILLQNSAGREKYALDDVTVLAVLQSTDSSTIQTVSNSTFGSSLAYSAETAFTNSDRSFLPEKTYAGNIHPLSASPVPQYHSVSSDFGAFGSAANAAVANPFAADTSPVAQRRAAPRRGRLFDLVDDGEEDVVNDVDVVSGMLGNLNVDLFQNSGVHDVDIEAISLMGIGGSPGPNNGLHPRRTHGRFG